MLVYRRVGQSYIFAAFSDDAKIKSPRFWLIHIEPPRGSVQQSPCFFGPPLREGCNATLRSGHVSHKWYLAIQSQELLVNSWLPFTDLQRGSKEMIFQISLEVCSGCEHCLYGINLDGQDSQGAWEEMPNRKAKFPSQLCNNLCIMGI